jgi:diguanylate cyclase (GGDEF)-like protein
LRLLLATAGVWALVGTSLHASTPRFGRLSVDQGLSQSTVQAILQDRDGFLWFGTEEGLDRYDGYAVTAFKHDPRDPLSLPADRVSALFEDSTRRLWIGTDAGLSFFDRRRETFAAVPGVKGRVTGFAERADGTLWIGVEGEGVFERNPKSGALLVHQHDPKDPRSLASWVPSALLYDRSGRLWVATKDAGLDMSLAPPGEPLQFAHFRRGDRAKGLSHDEVWGLAEAGGEIWIATYGGGVTVLDPKTGGVRQYKHDPHDPRSLGTDLTTAVFVDTSGTVWIGTDGAGVQQYEPSTDTFRALRNDPRDNNSLSQDVIRTLGQDRQGHLWVGTYLGGADVLRTPQHGFGYFTHEPSDPTSLPNPNVSSLLEDAQRQVWVGAAGGSLLSFDRKGGAFVPHPLLPILPGALSLFQDRGGRYWIGTYRGGLGRFDPARGVVAVYRHRPGDSETIGNDEVWAIAEDEGGFLWLGTNDGVDRFDPARAVVTAHFDTPAANTTTNAGTRALLADRHGRLWVGTIGGLYRIDGLNGATPSIARVRPDDPALSRDGVVALHMDRAGIIWLGTLGGGLKSIDPDTAALHVYKDFPSNAIYGIQEDTKGRLWLSTNHGLSRFDPSKGRSQSFDLSNGLQSLQFSLGANLKAHDGHLLFGSVDGLYDFDPDSIEADTFAPPVVLTAVRVFNEPLKLTSAPSALRDLTLSYRDKVFTLEFAALDYSLPRSNNYAYSMGGFSDAWLQLGAKREVTFTNLDPGTYSFRVKASNSDGVWTEEAPTLLTVVITPPLWGTGAFRLASLAVAASLLLVAHRLRVRRLTTQLVARQVTETTLRRSEEEVRRTVSVLQSTLESTADGILVVDRGGLVVSFNQRFIQLWRLPVDAVRSGQPAPLSLLMEQLRQPEQLNLRIQHLDTDLEGESFDLLEFRDDRVFECYSLPHRLDGVAIGRVWSFRDITERRRAEETVQFQAYHDALTGLPNRLLLEDRMAQALVHARRRHSPVAVIFLDVDHFKLINDTLGHATGDRLLKGIAERLQVTVRREDTVARLGGDEFTILFTELSHNDDAARTAEKILNAFTAPFVVDGRELYVTASIGVALFPTDGEDPDTLLRNADSAMYRAKEAGRHNYQLCTPGMNLRALERMTLEHALRRALDREEFVLHYQPFVSLASQRVVGIEALVRWNHPERGLLHPEVFIPIAEESRLIVPLGEWVLSTAARQLGEWRADGHERLRMAVNISARQLQQQTLVKAVVAAVEAGGIPPGCLELEITESATMQNLEWTQRVLRDLRERGVRISIDDFGTGQSSLSYLKHFPLSTLKIDRSFVRDIAVDQDDEAIVRAVIALAHILKLTVVAEGVETAAQHSFLREAGCEEGQGYLFSRPLPAAALLERLKGEELRSS